MPVFVLIFIIIVLLVVLPLTFFAIYLYKRKNKIRKIIREVEKRPLDFYKDNSAPDLLYKILGEHGRTLYIYHDRCVIDTKMRFSSVLVGNATDGEKTLYYSDIIGVQFKQAGSVLLGYLQLETASSSMNNRSSNYTNENSFPFYTTTVSNAHMRAFSNYIQKKIREAKENKGNVNTTVINPLSQAEELKKYKELLDIGVITQEEFDQKKKKLLNL